MTNSDGRAPPGRSTIWAAWLQGREAAPSHVRRILDLWERLNPDHRLVVLEQADADKILATLGIRQPRITPQVTTNLVRTYKLATEGGVWADSTLLPTRPLSDWLNGEITQHGFFAFRSTGDPNLVLQNWFLYSERDNPLISGWLEAYADYFSTPRLYPTWKRAVRDFAIKDFFEYRRALRNRDSLWFVDPERGRSCRFYPYAVHNYSFAQLLATRPDLRRLWDSVPSRTHALPAMIGRLAADRETREAVFFDAARQVLPLSPIHKLNHRDARFDRLVDIVEEVL